jgi:hypothetical protein
MGKFTDDVPLKPKGSVQPPSAHLLIRNLKVESASPEAKSKAVEKWLTRNVPGPSLERSLRRNGYGQLVDKQAQTATRRGSA